MQLRPQPTNQPNWTMLLFRNSSRGELQGSVNPDIAWKHVSSTSARVSPR